MLAWLCVSVVVPFGYTASKAECGREGVVTMRERDEGFSGPSSLTLHDGTWMRTIGGRHQTSPVRTVRVSPEGCGAPSP